MCLKEASITNHSGIEGPSCPDSDASPPLVAAWGVGWAQFWPMRDEGENVPPLFILETLQPSCYPAWGRNQHTKNRAGRRKEPGPWLISLSPWNQQPVVSLQGALPGLWDIFPLFELQFLLLAAKSILTDGADFKRLRPDYKGFEGHNKEWEMQLPNIKGLDILSRGVTF